jgi:lipid A 4'-phosphatase
MNRTGMLIVLVIAALTGLLFGLFPQLDIKISALFFNSASQSFLNDRAVLGGVHWAAAARDISMWVVTSLAVPAAVALLFKLLIPGTRLAMPARAIMVLLLTLALAPGLLTNVVLKEHWGRPRPIDVRDFAGPDRFMPWWDPRGQCPRNCSFVTGEGSGAFWTLAPAALAPAPLRPFAYTAAVGFGAAVGTLRMAYGGHFLTDVVSSGVFTFIIIWVVHGAFYRWTTSAISDEELESYLERLLDRVHIPVGRAILRVGSLLGRTLGCI